MKLTQREERYLKRLLKDREHRTRFWTGKNREENRLASSILNQIEIDIVLRNWNKEDK